jgi:eukaryotic-like serine/threonine-protein kinase
MPEETPAPRPAVQAGDLIAGKYRVERVLGEGGMGYVVAAMHEQLDERVAIKVLFPETLANAEAVARFQREARAAAKIKSEHVVRVTDVGTLDSGAPYMVMEHLEGQDLEGLVGESGRLTVSEAIDYILQACEALAEAHTIGIVHRDLKPANLFLARRADGSPLIKVLDFGISKYKGPKGAKSAMSMTKTTTVMGSPLYMAPEQMASSRDVDARADIWALGIILYELVSGEPPFNAETIPQLCMMAMNDPPPPLHTRFPEIPEELEAAILRCIEKKAVDRFANVAELANAIVPFGSTRSQLSAERVSMVIGGTGLNLTDVSKAVASAKAAPAQTGPGARTGTAWGDGKNGLGARGRTGKKVGLIAGGALLVAALAAVAIVTTTGNKKTVVATTAAPDLRTSVAEQPDSAATPLVSAEPSATAPAASTASAAPSAPPPVVTGATKVAKPTGTPHTTSTSKPKGGGDSLGGRL